METERKDMGVIKFGMREQRMKKSRRSKTKCEESFGNSFMPFKCLELNY